ncbi:hypothetical protein [Pontibacter amylolyticus]|uniref:Uncharacterized protein n=1 Tax=Pontibacter amylolyticus TaxID=1424080 RepID=A0ABQ1WEP8_9BACT|nr:hypothetical protein [Pontibacter amylolyticus]GGG27762.1 hypothetical protein GCM10011323_34050 [Pontibacter amylolyticus]
MKTFLLTVLATLLSLAAFACPVCEKQQPKVLQGISHGAGPQSDWDYVLVWATVVIVVLCLFFSIKWLVRPGEKGEDHIKRTVLDF